MTATLHRAAMRKKGLSPPEFVVIGVLLVVLAALGIAFGATSDEGGGGDSTAAVVAQVKPIAHRVEQIRGVRFRRLPEPVVVTPSQTRAAQLKDLDRDYPAKQRRADAELMELLGLVPPGTDLRQVLGDVAGGQVAGYYDPRRKRL